MGSGAVRWLDWTDFGRAFGVAVLEREDILFCFVFVRLCVWSPTRFAVFFYYFFCFTQRL